MYYVYVLESIKNGSYYIGHTHNLRERLNQHNSGRSKSTRSKRPWKLVFSESHASRSEAVRKELDLKNRKSKQYISKIIHHIGA